ncbi:MAG: carbon storage regulator [Xanthomonadales bacterium]|jgi:carbon storage regulator CsrA|nr:carbon storage regulator [Xanthomonadales bacterium]
MLILSRKTNESITIDVQPNTPESKALQALMRQGPIHIKIISTSGNACRIGIDAPKSLRILRDDVNPEHIGSAYKNKKGHH